MKAAPLAFRKAQAGKTVACCLPRSSRIDEASLQAAAWRLGMLPLMFPGEEMQGPAESLTDTVAVLSAYVDAIVIQTPAQSGLEQLADSSSVPVINALTDKHHPLQALADLLTLRERFGELGGLHQSYLGNGINVAELTGLHLAYVGDGNNIAHSLMEAGAVAGMHVAVASPAGHEPDAQIQIAAAEAADARGGSVRVVNDPAEAAAGADAVYADTWSGQTEETAAQHEEPRRRQVNDELMALAKPGAAFMHRRAGHHGQEVAEEIIDGPRSVAFQQARNLLPIEQAVLESLLSGSWSG
jgi:ornithine carbamoyltransferase